MALLLVWTWVKENIMPLGAFKAALMGTAGVSSGDVVLLSTQTASSSTVLDFTGLNSTYGEYIFKFYNTVRTFGFVLLYIVLVFIFAHTRH